MVNLRNKTLFVFTGGGLAPALNPTLYGVISEAQKNGMKILGGLFGWASLLENGRMVDLSNFKAEGLRDIGGTILRSSRTNPLAVKNGLEIVKEKLKEYKVDYIIAVGGDDTLGAANKLFHKLGVKIIGIPKTIDNDLKSTYWTPGFPSAAYYTARFCEEIKMDAAYALSRIFIIEVLGRKAGWVAASASFGSADVIIPPERKVSLKLVLEAIKEKYEENGNFATLVISEEAEFKEKIRGFAQDQNDSFKVKRKSFVALALKQKITEELGIDCKPLFPGNYLQTGKPIEIDAKIAVKLGQRAVNLIKKEKFGYMPAIKRPDITSQRITIKEVLLDEAVSQEKLLDDSYFDFENFKVKKKFLNYMAPILGKYKGKNYSYYKLINKIVNY